MAESKTSVTVITKNEEIVENNKTVSNENVNVNESDDVTNLVEINKPLFVMFAELLGYVSPLVEFANKICKGEKVDEYIKKIVDVDAYSIFIKMKEDFSLSDIREWYDKFYPIILKSYEDKMKKSNEAIIEF